MTGTEKIILSNYLREVIKNSYRCQHCSSCHGDTCFFAYVCIKKDFSFFKEAVDK
nr:hypothetical protein [uncultured Treponema sp.]